MADSTPPIPIHHRAWQDLLRTQKTVLDGLETALLRDAGVSVAWYYILLFLNEAADQRLQLYDLAGRLLLSRSGLSRRIDRMERAGLVRRERHMADRRMAFAVLTQQGHDCLMTASPGFRSSVMEHFGRYLSLEEFETLDRLLTKVLEGEGVQPQYAGRRTVREIQAQADVAAAG